MKRIVTFLLTIAMITGLAYISCDKVQAAETGECISVPFGADLRKLCSGQKRSFTLKLPVKDLKHGRYQIYFSVTDETSGEMILLGNKNEATDDGYLLGQLEK